MISLFPFARNASLMKDKNHMYQEKCRKSIERKSSGKMFSDSLSGPSWIREREKIRFNETLMTKRLETDAAKLEIKVWST